MATKKKTYTIQYHTDKYYTIEVKARSEAEAREIAEDKYCNFEDKDWKEYEETTHADVVNVTD